MVAMDLALFQRFYVSSGNTYEGDVQSRDSEAQGEEVRDKIGA